MDKAKLRETILKQIERPVIPSRKYSVLQFGVISDSDEIQTKILQQAIDTVNKNGGGTLIFPKGTYRTGALWIKSGVELHLESENTVLSFVNEEPERHYPLVYSHWEATPCYNFSALIYACDASDIALTGKGVLDGGADADHWWNWHHQVENAWSDNKLDLQLADRKELRRMNVEGVPVKDRVFGAKHYLRPNFVQLIRCKRVLIHGITLKNSPMWQLNPVMCKSLIVDGVTLASHGANNDGCDPESCNGVYICNCRFDTGDDCISLKSGRDRDGRLINMPCENVLIEHNEFADGHGGIALGSEMSGGIRCVLALENRFSSPNLTYALRFKTNARRGGSIEKIILADSEMEHVHGAAVHGTMLYEDGRNGDALPVFKDITIENVVAHGGDYGIFLEAFDEVPITGLTLRNIRIDGVRQTMRSMNWENPVIENVEINGKHFPRPDKVRILGVPIQNAVVQASVEESTGVGTCQFFWQSSIDGQIWHNEAKGESFKVPKKVKYLQLTAVDSVGNTEKSKYYRVLDKMTESEEQMRLQCRGMLELQENIIPEKSITRAQLAKMLMPLADKTLRIEAEDREECVDDEAMQIAIGNGFLMLADGRYYHPDGAVTRQEMATVAMQACGINYRNASSTMPVCSDVEQVNNNYGTNVARALYFGFMELDLDGNFAPQRKVSMEEAIRILNRVADFAGI